MVEQPVEIGAGSVSLEEVGAISRRERRVELSTDPVWHETIDRGRAALERAAREGRTIYGVNTGFGRTSHRQVPEAHSGLQLNLLRMHGCGVGPYLSEEESRAVMASRLISLAKGFSGVRHALLEALARAINSGITAAIPSFGSVGASGDLTPLSYVGALLLGERNAFDRGHLAPAREALDSHGIAPFEFAIKEGLALINGTSAMTAIGALVALRCRRVIDLAERGSALLLELIDGRSAAMHATVHRVKGHPGQIESAARLRSFLDGSGSAQNGDGASAGREVQDRYSVRCVPQLLGAARDAHAWVERVLETELNAVSDNPIVDPESGEILNGGNFYGGHVALAMDLLKISLGTTINLIDRQFAFLVSDANPRFRQTLLPDEWLPEEERGLHHGLKALQITVSSLTALAHQRSLSDALLSRQTECDNQDVVSMGTNAALNARAVLELTEQALAAWLIALSQAAAVRADERLSPAGGALVRSVREVVPIVEADRPLDQDIARLVESVVRDPRESGATDPADA